MGRRQPRMSFSHRSNTRTRIVGIMNAQNGAVRHWQRSRIDRKTFARFIMEVSRDYETAKKIYVIIDNWPVHYHPDVRTILDRDQRIELVPLPTYSPWLNYIEKVWRWLRQKVTHGHPYADDFNLFKERISEALDSLSTGSEQMLKYVGLADV
jgi:hypothetical protein